MLVTSASSGAASTAPASAGPDAPSVRHHFDARAVFHLHAAACRRRAPRRALGSPAGASLTAVTWRAPSHTGTRAWASCRSSRRRPRSAARRREAPRARRAARASASSPRHRAALGHRDALAVLEPQPRLAQRHLVLPGREREAPRRDALHLAVDDDLHRRLRCNLQRSSVRGGRGRAGSRRGRPAVGDRVRRRARAGRGPHQPRGRRCGLRPGGGGPARRRHGLDDGGGGRGHRGRAPAARAPSRAGPARPRSRPAARLTGDGARVRSSRPRDRPRPDATAAPASEGERAPGFHGAVTDAANAHASGAPNRCPPGQVGGPAATNGSPVFGATGAQVQVAAPRERPAGRRGAGRGRRPRRVPPAA